MIRSLWRSRYYRHDRHTTFVIPAQAGIQVVT